MRVFWILVAVLVIVAVAIPAVSAMSARRREQAAQAAAEATRDLATTQLELARRATEIARKSADQAAPAVPAQAPGAPEPQRPTTEPAGPTQTPATAPDPAKAAVPPSPATEGAPAPGAPAPSAPATEPLPGPTIVTRDDGSMLVDDRFVVKGKGTAEAPYEVTWEMLVSANETYDPRQGRKRLPGRITMLDGKHVRLTGYIAYPMFVEQPRELLSMLNQWDGCCIGVPPTPYDAVEVHLKDVVAKEDRLATYGAVEGKLGVKPYLAGDWLVGLYVLEDAGLTVKEYGGFGS